MTFCALYKPILFNYLTTALLSPHLHYALRCQHTVQLLSLNEIILISS